MQRNILNKIKKIIVSLTVAILLMQSVSFADVQENSKVAIRGFVEQVATMNTAYTITDNSALKMGYQLKETYGTYVNDDPPRNYSGTYIWLCCATWVSTILNKCFGIEIAGRDGTDGYATTDGWINPLFKEVSKDELTCGDIIMWSPKGQYYGHMGMYLGNNQVTDCSPSNYNGKTCGGVYIRTFWDGAKYLRLKAETSAVDVPDSGISGVVGMLTQWKYVKVPFRNVTESSIDKNKTFSYQGIAKSSAQTIINNNIPKGESLGIFNVSAYDACYKCCGKNPGDPGYGITASGAVAQANHTIATDPSVIPTGTHVIINGKEYVAEDTGGDIKGNKIDIYFDTHEEAKNFGRNNIEVYLADTSTGGTSTDGGSSSTTSNSSSGIFSYLSKILDYILGLIFIVVKSVFVGLATIIQIGTTYYIDAATGKAVENRLSNGMMEYLSNSMREDLKNSITLEKIVYNQVPILDVDVFNGNQAGGETIANGSFVMIIRNLVATLYMALRNVALIGMLIALIYLGIRLVTSSIGEQKAEYRKKLTSWIVAFIIVFVMHYFLIGVMKINELIVNICSNIGKNIVSAVSGGEYFDLALAMRDLTYEIPFTKSALAMILYFVMVFYMLKFLVIYFKRLFITSILIIIGPLLAIKNAIDKIRFNKSTSMSTWMKEYIFSVGTQTIHALIYTIFVGTTYKLIATSDNMRIAVCILSCMFFRVMTTAEKLTRKMLKLVGEQSDSIMGDVEHTDIRELFGFALIARMNKMTSNMSVPQFVKRKYQKGKAFVKGHLASEYVKIKRKEYMNNYLDAYMPDDRNRRTEVTSDVDKKIEELIVADLDYKMSNALGSISSVKNFGKSIYHFASGSVMMGIGPVVLGTTRVYTGTKTMSKILYSPIKGYKLSEKNMQLKGQDGTYQNIKQWTELNGTKGVADVIRKDYLNKRDDVTAKNNLKIITLHQARKVEVGLEQEIADKKETLLKGAEPGATKMEKELAKKYTKNIRKCAEDRMKTVDRKDIQKEVKTYMKKNGKFALTLNDFENISEKLEVKVSGEKTGEEKEEKVQKEEFIENVKAETMARFIKEITEKDGVANEITLDKEAMDIVENKLKEKLDKSNENEKEGVQNALKCLKDKKNELEGKEKLHTFSNLSEEQQKQVNQAIADATTDEVIEKEIPKLSRDQIVDTMKKAVNMEGSIKREEPIKEFKQVINHVEKLRDIDEVSRELGNEPIYKDIGDLVETMIKNTKITNREEKKEK